MVYYICKEKKRKRGMFMLKLNEKPINYKGDNLHFYGTNYISCPENIAIAIETEFHEPYCTLTVNLSDYGYVFKNGIIAIDHNVLFMPELLNVFIKTFCVEDFVMPVHYGFANSILVKLLPEVYEKIKEDIQKEETEESV